MNHQLKQTSEANQVSARSELKEGTSAFKAGRYLEAQQHFEKSLELDPSQKNIRFLIARAIHAQYRPGVETAENIAKAREAIAGYQKVLAEQPNNEEAYNAVSVLYGALKDEDQQRNWILMRASRDTLPREKRSEAYAALARKDWNCSYAITEQSGNKQGRINGDQTVAQSKNLRNQKDFNTAKQCATRGLELAEKAVRLIPESELAWVLKTNLLFEMVKLAEMEGLTQQQAAYKKQASLAQQRATELSEANRKKAEEARSN